jgi:hypothetical protein
MNMKKLWFLLLFVIPMLFVGCHAKTPQDMIPEDIPGFQISPLEVAVGERFVTFKFYTVGGSEFDDMVNVVYCVIEDCISERAARDRQSEFMGYCVKETVQVEGLNVVKGRRDFDDGHVPDVRVSLVKGQYLVYCAAEEIGPLMLGNVTVDNEEFADSALKASMEVLKAIIPNLPD